MVAVGRADDKNVRAPDNSADKVTAGRVPARVGWVVSKEGKRGELCGCQL